PRGRAEAPALLRPPGGPAAALPHGLRRGARRPRLPRVRRGVPAGGRARPREPDRGARARAGPPGLADPRDRAGAAGPAERVPGGPPFARRSRLPGLAPRVGPEGVRLLAGRDPLVRAGPRAARLLEDPRALRGAAGVAAAAPVRPHDLRAQGVPRLAQGRRGRRGGPGRLPAPDPVSRADADRPPGAALVPCAGPAPVHALPERLRRRRQRR